FIFADILQMAAAYCMVHQIPPWNFMVPCVLLNETFLSPFSAGFVESWSGLTREQRAPVTKTPVVLNEEGFLCCVWGDNNMDCSLYRASMQTRKLIPSEKNGSAPQEIDSCWSVECQIKGEMDVLVCSLRFLKLHSRDDLKANLLYTVSELSLGNVSTSSLKGPVLVAQCDCREYRCECCIPSLQLNQTYIMWLKMTVGVTALWSPLMAVKPLDVVKPEPPLNLHVEMTEEGEVMLHWSNPVLVPYLLQYEVKISANSGQRGWQMVQVALGTSLAVDNTLLDSSYLVQVRCRNRHGPGFWSDWSTPYHLNLGAEVLYFPPKLLTSVGSNISFHCIYKNQSKVVVSKEIVWWLNLAEEIPASQYTLANDRVSKVTLFNLTATKPRGSFFYNALYCCHQTRECHHRYAELYVVDVNVDIVCETDGYLTKMTCRWSAKPNTLLLGCSLSFRYYRNKIYCSDFPRTSPESEVKECHLQNNHSYECTFQPIFLLSGYTMWVEFQHSLATLKSPPTCIVPADVVKLLPPSSVKAEITRNVGLLNVSWTNPIFANSDLMFQIRYAVNREEMTWELYEVSSVPRSAVIKVQKLCVEYVVQVRCRELDGSGYWSNWSRPAYTLVRDIKAPLQGPEFWRIVTEDPARRQKNVTLLWKPLIKSHSLCSVSHYVVKHQTSGNATWSEYVEHGTTCSFPWAERTHTVTVLAMNSMGVSAVNLNLTLSQQMSTVNVVQSLHAYPVNSTCVILVWTLSLQLYVITSFVIEWKNLNKEEEMKWVRVPPNISKYYLYDHFILIEKYHFSLYPVFAEGVGKSRATEHFTKGGYEEESNANLSVVLPVVFSTSILLLGGFLVSQQRMKKLFWQDIPNPKNCSWAQEVNFQKPETFEHLFIKQPGAMSFEPLLLEPEIVLQDISVTNVAKKEDTPDFFIVDSVFTKTEDSEHDSACSSSHFNSDSFSESSRDDQVGGEPPRPSDVKYAAVISNSRLSSLYNEKMNLSSCFGRCFLADDSVLTGTFSRSSWEVANGTFLLLGDPPGRQPSKALSLSLISSEGFSEPSDQDEALADRGSPEQSLCYLGITPLDKRQRALFSAESSGAICRFHTADLLTDQEFHHPAPPNLKAFIQSSLKYKAMVPYVPQFQMSAAKGQETTEK
ncbi:LEPR protein, partial [Rhinopomastus cyanomelas]|nr:LEPR protein [Rhinopomastus cyanomelas]